MTTATVPVSVSVPRQSRNLSRKLAHINDLARDIIAIGEDCSSWGLMPHEHSVDSFGRDICQYLTRASDGAYVSGPRPREGATAIPGTSHTGVMHAIIKYYADKQLFRGAIHRRVIPTPGKGFIGGPDGSVVSTWRFSPHGFPIGGSETGCISLRHDLTHTMADIQLSAMLTFMQQMDKALKSKALTSQRVFLPEVFVVLRKGLYTIPQIKGLTGNKEEMAKKEQWLIGDRVMRMLGGTRPASAATRQAGEVTAIDRDANTVTIGNKEQAVPSLFPILPSLKVGDTVEAWSFVGQLPETLPDSWSALVRLVGHDKADEFASAELEARYIDLDIDARVSDLPEVAIPADFADLLEPADEKTGKPDDIVGYCEVVQWDVYEPQVFVGSCPPRGADHDFYDPRFDGRRRRLSK